MIRALTGRDTIAMWRYERVKHFTWVMAGFGMARKVTLITIMHGAFTIHYIG